MQPHEIRRFVWNALADATSAHIGKDYRHDTVTWKRDTGRVTVKLPCGTQFEVTVTSVTPGPDNRPTLDALDRRYWLVGDVLHACPLDPEGTARTDMGAPVDLGSEEGGHELFMQHLTARSWLTRITMGWSPPLQRRHLIRDSVVYWLDGDDLVACPTGATGELLDTHQCRITPEDTTTGVLAEIVARLRK